MNSAKSRPFSADEDRVLLQAIETVGSRNGFRDWLMVHKEAKVNILSSYVQTIKRLDCEFKQIPDFDKDQLKQRYSNLRKRGILTLVDFEDSQKLKMSGRLISRDNSSPEKLVLKVND